MTFITDRDIGLVFLTAHKGIIDMTVLPGYPPTNAHDIEARGEEATVRVCGAFEPCSLPPDASGQPPVFACHVMCWGGRPGKVPSQPHTCLEDYF